MPISKSSRPSLFLLLPVFGIVLFVILYVIATRYYPGGSQVDAKSVGFSWLNNYWCNLLNEKSINGKFNPARPIALVAMVALCLSLSAFWYIFPQQTGFKKFSKLAIQLSGIVSMLISLFLFTQFHDVIINMSALFGLVAIVGTFNGLYKQRWYWLLYFGTLNLLLVALNNYVYYTKGLIVYLPVIQKITFLTFLLWISCINIKLYWKAS